MAEFSKPLPFVVLLALFFGVAETLLVIIFDNHFRIVHTLGDAGLGCAAGFIGVYLGIIGHNASFSRHALTRAPVRIAVVAAFSVAALLCGSVFHSPAIGGAIIGLGITSTALAHRGLRPSHKG